MLACLALASLSSPSSSQRVDCASSYASRAFRAMGSRVRAVTYISKALSETCRATWLSAYGGASQPPALDLAQGQRSLPLSSSAVPASAAAAEASRSLTPAIASAVVLTSISQQPSQTAWWLAQRIAEEALSKHTMHRCIGSVVDMLPRSCGDVRLQLAKC